MLDWSDKQTYYSIRELWDEVKQDKKALLFWIGAGPSAWCGYPLWDELANRFHSEFLKYESQYVKNTALTLIESRKYPDLFQMCKETNEQRYNVLLEKSFQQRTMTPVYQRFLDSLNAINPLYIVTTNIDDCLERNLKNTVTVQGSDIERCINLQQNKQSYICKMHGSISSLRSVILTSNDYATLITNEHYLSLIRHIFSENMVVFFGYGLNDQYILDLLANNMAEKELFGDGPHFAILPHSKANLPKSVRTINYISEPQKDHRSAIQIIEDIRIAKHSTDSSPISSIEHHEIVSAHLIAGIYPPGTWESSVTLGLKGEDGTTRNAFIGNGFTNFEMPSAESTAMHDLIVGLICFDVVYAPLSSVAKVHNLFGSDFFWELVKQECLQFINWKSQIGIVYPPDSATCGDLGNKPDHSDKTIQELIRTFLIPVPGKEQLAYELFALLESKTTVIDKNREPNIVNMTRGLLLRQSLRNTLGISGGTPITSIPSWVKFPVIRLANIVRIGATCQLLGIASTKLEFGSEGLVAQAFGCVAETYLSDEMASYVIAGRFGTDLGKAILGQTEIFSALLKFRKSSEGCVFRKSILEQLSMNSGADFSLSINAGLKNVIPTKILQAAHDKFSALLLSQNLSGNLTPAIWSDPEYTKKALSLWRQRGLNELREYCRVNHIGQYDQCPCGSGEKLKFCCEESLKS
jgi:hypothetical protein